MTMSSLLLRGAGRVQRPRRTFCVLIQINAGCPKLDQPCPMEQLDYEPSDYFAEQAHLACHLSWECTDPVGAAKLGQLAREFAAKAINLGASPERLRDIFLAPGSSMDSIHHRATPGKPGASCRTVP
jgi:hypothetical protein